MLVKLTPCVVAVVADGKDVAEDVVVGLHPFCRPESSSTVEG